MKIKTIGVLVGFALCFGVVTGFANNAMADFVEEEFEDYEIFDDVEDLIDEEFVDDVTADVDPADDVPAPRAVAERMSCVDIETRIAELRADVKAYPELRADLEYMLTRQRNQCAPRATRRPVHNYKNVNPVVEIEAVPPEENVIEEPVQEDVVEEVVVDEEARQAQIAENFANGLCGDGANPNKYGCCAGEVFKQLEHLEFACCPKNGDGECREPSKKK